MNMNRRFFITLTGAAAIAWDHVLAGSPESAPNYKIADHWWAMLIDVDKCIGCGNCVRACAVENNVPEGFFRTWIERYQVDDEHMADPIVDSPNGGMNGFPARPPGTGLTGTCFKGILRPQALQSLRRFALHPGLSRRRDLHDS